MKLKVVDHNKFCFFNYDNEISGGYQLGDVVAKEIKEDKECEQEATIEIGVVIQTFGDGDFRTDMFGMASPSEVRFATLDDIELYRNDLMSQINIHHMKDEIERILISKWASIGMDRPSNFENIVQDCYEDVMETADPVNWNDSDVAIAFRRWIEKQEN